MCPIAGKGKLLREHAVRSVELTLVNTRVKVSVLQGVEQFDARHCFLVDWDSLGGWVDAGA